MTIKFKGPHIEGSFCTSIDYNYDPIISVLCAMYIAFGIVYTLFGEFFVYFLFNLSIFHCGMKRPGKNSRSYIGFGNLNR